MVRRTRDIQKKIWLTPQEERTIAKKMEMIGTENFGAYARKMLIDGYIIVVDYTEQKKLAAEINKISSPSGKQPRPCGRWGVPQYRALHGCGGRCAPGFRFSPKSRW